MKHERKSLFDFFGEENDPTPTDLRHPQRCRLIVMFLMGELLYTNDKFRWYRRPLRTQE